MPKKKKVPKRVYYRMYDGASIYRALWAGMQSAMREKDYVRLSKKIFFAIEKELKDMGGS